VVSTVEQAYYGMLGARQLLVVQELCVKAALASLDVVQARQRSGLATEGETAQVETAWAKAKYS
jgi:outer membrane protein TolC